MCYSLYDMYRGLGNLVYYKLIGYLVLCYDYTTISSLTWSSPKYVKWGEWGGSKGKREGKKTERRVDCNPQIVAE